MKKRLMTTVLTALFLAFLLLVFSCGGDNGGDAGGTCSAPTVNVTGTWVVTETSTNNNCGDSVDPPYSLEASQSSSSLTVSDSSGHTFSGQICGNTIKWSGSYPDSGGTTYIDSLSATVSSNGASFSGSSSWHWTDGVYSCSGTTQFTGALQ